MFCRHAFAVALVTAHVAACGGGAPPKPKPLSHHFDQAYVAQVPTSEQEAMLRAQNEYHKARAAFLKAEADLKESKTLLEVAKNERKQALLEEESAAQKQDAAEESADMNRINASRAGLRVAELSRRAADEKVAALKAHRAYLKKWILYTEEQMYHKEAKFELAKARLAKANNISPKGFEFANYESQARDRSKKAQRRKVVADKEKSKAAEKKKAWKTRLKEAEQARGVSSASE